MGTKNKFRKEGEIIEALSNGLFRVKIISEDKEILAYLSGKMRLNFIRVMPGDKVTIELSPYDQKRGRILFRKK